MPSALGWLEEVTVASAVGWLEKFLFCLLWVDRCHDAASDVDVKSFPCCVCCGWVGDVHVAFAAVG